ncbi:MAG: pyridoxamine 5'-phosphate oxidase family protein [Deltaproteobacteria bacterium]|nr:pyridoxamine 5'-phosphate oxidase family protein [Deltaproteobacteria bacterium]
MNELPSEPSVAMDSTPEEAESAQRIDRDEAVTQAVHLLRAARHGVLSTISHKHDGWPFGSVVPYALTVDGDILIYTASIAQHTRNFRADPRACLLVYEDPSRDADVQAHARLSVMGTVAEAIQPEAAQLWPLYQARVPSAPAYGQTHDFKLYRIVPAHLRYIGGFGAIFWLDVEAYRTQSRR